MRQVVSLGVGAVMTAFLFTSGTHFSKSVAEAATAPSVTPSYYISDTMNPYTMGENQTFGSGGVILDFMQAVKDPNNPGGMG